MSFSSDRASSLYFDRTSGMHWVHFDEKGSVCFLKECVRYAFLASRYELS